MNKWARQESYMRPCGYELGRDISMSIASSLDLFPHMQRNYVLYLTPDMHVIICKNTVLVAFTEQFRSISETEIDGMMQSVAFTRHIHRMDLVQLLQMKFQG